MAAPTLLTVCRKEKKRPPPLEDVDDFVEPTFWATPEPLQSPGHVEAGVAAAAAFLARVAKAAPAKSHIVPPAVAPMRQDTTHLQSLQQDLDEMRPEMQMMTQEVARIGLEMEAIRPELDVMKYEIAHVRSSISEIESIKMNMNYLKTSRLELEAFKSELEMMREEMARSSSSDAEIKSIKMGMKTSRLKIEAIKPELDIMKQEIVGVVSSIAEMESIKMDMQHLKTSRLEIEAFKPELELMRQEIAGLRSSSACIDAITADMRHLKSCVSDMEAMKWESPMSSIGPQYPAGCRSITMSTGNLEGDVEALRARFSELTSSMQGELSELGGSLRGQLSEFSSAPASDARAMTQIEEAVQKHKDVGLNTHEPDRLTDTVELPDCDRRFGLRGKILGRRGRTLRKLEKDTGSVMKLHIPNDAPAQIVITARTPEILDHAVRAARHLADSISEKYSRFTVSYGGQSRPSSKGKGCSRRVNGDAVTAGMPSPRLQSRVSASSLFLPRRRGMERTGEEGCCSGVPGPIE